MRAPGRTLPRALIGASVLVIVLYLFVNAGYFYVLSPEAVANISATSSVAGEVLVRLLGAGGAALLTAGLMLSSFGALHSNSLTTSRVPFAMARHGLLPRPLARVSPRTHVPTRAVLRAALFLLGTAYLMINTLYATTGRALAGMGIVALGLPLYVYYARQMPRARPEDWLEEK